MSDHQGLPPGTVVVHAALPSPALVRLSRYYRPERGRIALITILSVFSAQVEALALVLLVPLAQAIAEGDNEFAAEPGPFEVTMTVNQLVAVAVLAIVTALVLNLLITFIRARTAAHWQQGKRTQLIADFLAADWGTQAAERSGFLPVLNSFVAQGGIVLMKIADLIKSAATVLIFVTTAVLIDLRAAATIVAAALVLFMALRPIVDRIRQASRSQATLSLRYGEELGELAESARDVRVFGATGHFERRLLRLSKRIERVRARQAFLSGASKPLYQYSGMLLVLVAIVLAAQVETVDVAGLGAIALLLLRSLSYSQGVQSSYQAIQNGSPYLERLEGHRDHLRENAEQDGTITLEGVRTLDFDRVSFTYDGTHAALDDIDLEMRVGEIVGLVGASGSGKSTLSQLLLRLREPTSGRIVVDGQPIDGFTRSSWYRHVTLVPQETALVNATVADNIAFFDPSISRERVVEAARDAGIHDVVARLEDGYDTLIGQGFRSLSGGQVQRIGIARALARQAQVLVLDEPTSALDVHSEALIQRTLDRLRGRMLLVIIAHRLSTLSICDRLVVLKDGRVEADGPLEEVFAHSDYFRTALDAGLLDLGEAEPSPPA